MQNQVDIQLNFEGDLTLAAPPIALGPVHPVLNGIPLATVRPDLLQSDAQTTQVSFSGSGLGTALFYVQISREDESHLSLLYWIEHLPDSFQLDSFGIRFERVKNLRAYLRSGYHSWDGSEYVEPECLTDFEPYEKRPEIGYAMTQLLPRDETGSLVIGFDRHDRFQQSFAFDTTSSPPSLTISTCWDRKPLGPESACRSETLWLFTHSGIEEALREWAGRVAAASPTPPRRAEPIIGWCSWYNLYAYIDETIILEHLDGVAERARGEQWPMRVFQIDDGFTPEMGDWLEVKPQFPRGMKPLLDEIRSQAFIPGLWIAPFMVGNRSHLYRDHPDWVVVDRATGGPLVQQRFYGEYRWHKRSEEYYILDTTHPEAFEYLRRVFRTWRSEWGCEYFKTDFMHFGSGYGPDRAVRHTPGLTRIEVWRRAAEMVREEIGDAFWLGCGCPLWACVGLVDAVRIGGDVGVEWTGERAAQSLLRDQATRNFGNGVLWLSDPDCILLRERFHYLTDGEVRALAIYAGMAGGVLMTSDPVYELAADRAQLWTLLLNPRPGSCRFPMLGRSRMYSVRLPARNNPDQMRHEQRLRDPVIVQVRSGPDLAAVFLFNIGETTVERVYDLAALGLDVPLYAFDWSANRAGQAPVDRLAAVIPPHEGILLFLSSSPILVAPAQLP